MNRPVDPALSTVRLLGPIVLDGPQGLVPTRSTFLRTLLALLAVVPGTLVSTDGLIDELWGEVLPRDPKGAVQIQVTRLRKWLATGGIRDNPLRNEHGGYVLDLTPDRVDLSRFLDTATRALDLPAGRPERRLAACDEAMRHWTGDPFGGGVLSLRLEGERARACERFLQLVERRCEALIELGRHAGALAELGAYLPRYRSRERLTALSMIALYRSGRQRDALELHAGTRRFLAEEYGLEPGAELGRLEQLVLRQAPELLVERRADDTAPDRQRPDIVGRDEELALIRGLLAAAGPGRVVVVEGEAGAGKSTLAAAALHDAAAAGATGAIGAWDDDEAPLAGWDEVLAGLQVEPSVLAGSRHRLPGRMVRAALANMALDGPVLVVLDDIHLADSASLGILRALARLGLPHGVVVLVCARVPDAVAHPAWDTTHADLARGDVVAVRLGELPLAAARALVSARLAPLGPAVTARLGRTLWDRSSGNPLYLTALLDHLAGLPDEHSCLAAAEQIPDRLRPMLRHQLGRLPAACLDIVEVMAVLGPVAPAAVAAAVGASVLEVTQSLRPALELGLVRGGGDDLGVRHGLITRAVLDGIAPAARCAVHHRRFDALRATAGDPFEILRHAVGAGSLLDIGRLAEVQLAAGSAAYRRGAHAEAVTLLGAAHRHAPAAIGATVALHLGLALAAVGRTDEADDLLDGLVAQPDVPDATRLAAAVGHQPLGFRIAGDRRRLARLEQMRELGPGTAAERVELLQALVIEERLTYGGVRTPEVLSELSSMLPHLDGDAAALSLARIRAVGVRERLQDSLTPATLTAAEALHTLAATSGDATLALDATELLMAASLAAGQLERCRDLRWALGREGERVNRPRSIWSAALVAAALELAAGEVDVADTTAGQALTEGLRLGIPDAKGAYGIHLVTRSWIGGTLGGLDALIADAIRAYPGIAGWSAVAAMSQVQAGDPVGARRHLAEFARRRLHQTTRYFDPPALCFAAAAALALGDQDVATTVLSALPAHPDATVVVGIGAAVLGPVTLFVGMAEWARGDVDAAHRHLVAAERTADRLGWSPWRSAAAELRTAVDGIGRLVQLPGDGAVGTALPLGLRLYPR